MRAPQQGNVRAFGFAVLISMESFECLRCTRVH